MKSKLFSKVLSLAVLSAISSLPATEQEKVQIYLSEIEAQEIFRNPEASFIYVGPEGSRLAEIITEISKFDDSEGSLVRALADHISKGFSIGNYNAVAQALEEAEALVVAHRDRLGEDRTRALSHALNTVIEQVIEDNLTLDAELLSFLRDQVDVAESATRSGLRLLSVHEKSHFHGRAKFFKDVEFKKHVLFKDKVKFDDKVKFKEDVKFEDDVLFESDVTIEGVLSATDVVISGTLSTTDEVIDCNLTVGCNISMNDSISPAVGNIIKGGAPFIHNFGTNNTFVGENAGNFTMTGVSNTVVGTDAFIANTTGTQNVAVGTFTLAANTTGVQNTAIGHNALNANTIGDANVAVGTQALALNTTGATNTAIGQSALAANMTGSDNTAIGHGALASHLVNNTVAVGVNALSSNTTGTGNTAVGYFTLPVNTIGDNNTAIGFEALFTNTTGIQNTAVGTSSLLSNTIGLANTAVGEHSLFSNTTGSTNTALGQNTLSANMTGSNNTAVGHGALVAHLVDNTVAVGVNALSSNTTGVDNTSVGYFALNANTVGTDNTALGYQALLNVTSGSGNIGIGSNVGPTLTTGSDNIYIDADAATAAEADTTRIGTMQTRAFMAGIHGVTTGLAAIAVLVDANGQLGTVSSSRQFKHDVADMGDASSRVMALRPVTFVYNDDALETTQYGLIAEEADEVFPGIVVRHKDGNPYTIQYHVLPVLLLNEMQKLSARVAALEDRA